MFVVLAILGVFATIGFAAIVYSWRLGLLVLVVALSFIGYVILLNSNVSILKVTKDFVFVIPLYLSFFIFHMKDLKDAYIPTPVAVFLGLLILIILIHMINPASGNALIALVGAKVWLLYIPLILIASAYVTSENDLLRFLRVYCYAGAIPCAIGLTQWLLSATNGYVETMTFFYGYEAAYNATQKFAYFNLGAGFYRIPSTFTFSSQYANHTYIMLAASFALMRLETNLIFKKFAVLIFVLAVFASLMSGSRGALAMAPLLIAIIVILEGRMSGYALSLTVIPALILGAFSLAGLADEGTYDSVSKLGQTYASSFVANQFEWALSLSPLGEGVGMATGGARFIAGDTQLLGFESYYAKTIAEIGIPGLIILAGLHVTLLLLGLRNHLGLQNLRFRSVSATFMAFLILTIIASFKEPRLDFDPTNVMFWILMGILFKLPLVDNRNTQDFISHEIATRREPSLAELHQANLQR